MRASLKRGVEALCGGSIAKRAISLRRKGALLVLALHNVIPDQEPSLGDRSLHLPLSVFTTLIDRLLEVCVPARLGEPQGPDRLVPSLAVTFDDAYRGALEYALPVLERRGVPSTVFVPTGLMSDQTFWWDALADAKTGLDPNIRRHGLESLAGDGPRICSWAEAIGKKPEILPPAWRSATIDELRGAAGHPGVELAPHSVSHRALDCLGASDLELEMVGPFKWFELNGLPYRRFLAYPYGRSSDAVRLAAAAAGYESGWEISGGWDDRVPTNAPLARPRLNLPAGASPNGLMMRASGLLPS